jgi:glycine C-acetyltransferase/8-amino-7-oxononanoate synthase
VEDQVDVIVGTLGKALGAYGAYVACTHTMRELLVNTSRPLIFSTAPPPPAVAGALAALELLVEEPRMVDRLGGNADALRDELRRQGFDASRSTTQILPIIVGDPGVAMRICEAAIQEGVFAQAIRPPTVPPGTSRLRLAVMASHTKDELREAARTLARVARKEGAAGLPPSPGPPAQSPVPAA